MPVQGSSLAILVERGCLLILKLLSVVIVVLSQGEDEEPRTTATLMSLADARVISGDPGSVVVVGLFWLHVSHLS